MQLCVNNVPICTPSARKVANCEECERLEASDSRLADLWLHDSSLELAPLLRGTITILTRVTNLAKTRKIVHDFGVGY